MLIGVPTDDERPGSGRVIALASVLTVAGAGALAYGRFLEPRTLLVRAYDLALPNLPAELDGCRVGFVSDFHVGGPGDCLPAVNQALKFLEHDPPDLILLGGDFYDQGMRTGDEPDWSRFPRIAPTFAVPGNHDYKSEPEDSSTIFDSLRGAGIDVMHDSARTVAVKCGAIDLIGIDDPYTGRADFDSAQRSTMSVANPRILLAHAGMIADELPVGSVDLILSGHTHGAQIRVSPFKRTTPLDLFWWLDQLKSKPISPYRQGLFWIRGSLLYVGNGIGMTSFGVRFLAPPELAYFRLWRGRGNPELPCDIAERYVLHSALSRVWSTA